jgi:hypothetical protein
MGHNPALLVEGTIKTTKNERCGRKPDVANVKPVLALIYVYMQMNLLHCGHAL